MARAKKSSVRKLWTSADIKALKALAGRHPLATIARRLKRTAAATQRQASVKGISLAMNSSGDFTRVRVTSRVGTAAG